jgi:epoxyqueuosine reductase
VNGYSPQEVCPWNQRFARALPDDSPFAPREFLRGKDARTLARDLLQTIQEEFGAAFRGSPMKRAKLRGLKRNACVVLGNVGAPRDVGVLTRALGDPEALVREHAAWALDRIPVQAATTGAAGGMERTPALTSPARPAGE